MSEAAFSLCGEPIMAPITSGWTTVAQGLAQLVRATLPALDVDRATGSVQRGPLDRFGGTRSNG